MKDKKIELVLELMKHRQVDFLKSKYGGFYYFCHGIKCNECQLKYFCEKHFQCKAPSVCQEQYNYLKNLIPENFL